MSIRKRHLKRKQELSEKKIIKDGTYKEIIAACDSLSDEAFYNFEKSLEEERN